jgi:DNA-binding NtrC family response regulator
MQATNEISPESDNDAATILVAEDEVLLRMMLSDHLRAHHFHVLEAANGAEARKIIISVEHVDAVISDVHMAEEGEGLVLARWLGEHYPGIPVILASGSSGVAKARAWEGSANVTDFVPKPYSLEAIERLVRTRIAARDISPK